MNLLVLDTETTGLDPKTDALIEIACALYSVEERTTLWSFATLVPTVAHNPIPEINGITDGMLAEVRKTANRAARYAFCMRESLDASAIVAHSAEFDRSFLEHPIKMPALPWVCSKEDIAYPKERGSKSLAHLAADHGLAFGAQRHRALADVLLLCDLLACVDNLEEQVNEALKPRALFQSLQPFEQNDEAKKRGFRWNAQARRWEKRLPIDTTLKATADRPFAIRQLEDQQ